MAQRTVAVRMRAGVILVAVGLFGVVSSASATFPGGNGLLAFSGYSLNEESSDIVVDDVFVGVGRVPLGPRQIFTRGSGPAFSPRGRRLAFAKEWPRDGIWLTRPDCRWRQDNSLRPRCGSVQLTRKSDESPAWSANAKRLAFVRNDSRIYTVPASGGDLAFVARGDDPDWSQRGALAFTAPDDRGIRVRATAERCRRGRSCLARGATAVWWWAPVSVSMQLDTLVVERHTRERAAPFA